MNDYTAQEIGEQLTEQLNEQNKQFGEQTREVFETVQKMAQPGDLQKVVEEGLDKSREAYQKSAEQLKVATKEYEKTANAARKGLEKISHQLAENFEENNKAAFAFASKLGASKTWPEINQLQMDYLTTQFERFSAQSKTLFELSQKVSSETTKSAIKATEKTFKDISSSV